LAIDPTDYNNKFIIDTEEENAHAFYDKKGNINPILKR
jgi:hypothetical protein